MSVYCVISLDSRRLLNRLEISDAHSDYRWVMFDCDIQTQRGLQDVKEWLLEITPAYILISLKSFSERDCSNEQNLSKFLEEKNIPAQFLLPEQSDWHNVKAIAASAQLNIHELTLDRLKGQELLNSIRGFITVYHSPPVVRSYHIH